MDTPDKENNSTEEKIEVLKEERKNIKYRIVYRIFVVAVILLEAVNLANGSKIALMVTLCALFSITTIIRLKNKKTNTAQSLARTVLKKYFRNNHCGHDSHIFIFSYGIG